MTFANFTWKIRHTSFTGNEIPFDVMPIPEFVKKLPGRNSSATHEIVFLAFQLPPLGSKSFYIQANNKSRVTAIKKEMNETLIENEVGYN